MKNVKEYIKKIPIASGGMGLGIIAFGNLMQGYSKIIYNFCGMISICILAIIFIKCICYPDLLKKDMKCPIRASISGTFSATLILLSVYLKSFIGDIAFLIWLIGIMFHIILIIYFTKQFILKLQMNKVYASYFIVYVGIVAASITAPAFGQLVIGRVILRFGFLALISVFFLTLIRYIKYPNISEVEKPLICIYAAPLSLCIIGYLHSGTIKSLLFLEIMLIINGILYICALINAVKCLALRFYPSYASLTFPFVISALALKKAVDYLIITNQEFIIFQYIVWIKIMIAVLFVMYVGKEYMKYLLKLNCN